MKPARSGLAPNSGGFWRPGSRPFPLACRSSMALVNGATLGEWRIFGRQRGRGKSRRGRGAIPGRAGISERRGIVPFVVLTRQRCALAIASFLHEPVFLGVCPYCGERILFVPGGRCRRGFGGVCCCFRRRQRIWLHTHLGEGRSANDADPQRNKDRKGGDHREEITEQR